MDLVSLNYGQVTKRHHLISPPPLLTSTPHKREDVWVSIYLNYIHIFKSLQHRSTDDYENLHVYVLMWGEGFYDIFFITAPHQVAQQHIYFCTVQSIPKLSTWSAKMLPTWPIRQHFAMFLLNRHYNWRNNLRGPMPTVPNSMYATFGPEGHEQMFRSCGDSQGQLKDHSGYHCPKSSCYPKDFAMDAAYLFGNEPVDSLSKEDRNFPQLSNNLTLTDADVIVRRTLTFYPVKKNFIPELNCDRIISTTIARLRTL
ncbi:hypothetical protein TNCV_1054761 [Trichonephila clavipes]|nr:hypothetical protein TNCV_1054761 [Trichonephila clavipes]